MSANGPTPPTLITAEDLFSGGGPENYKLITLQTILKNGVPASVYIRPLPVSAMLAFIDMDDNASQVVKRRGLMDLAANALVNPNGTPMIDKSNRARLEEMSMATLEEISREVLDMAGLRATPPEVDAQGNPVPVPVIETLNPDGTSNPTQAPASKSPVDSAEGKESGGVPTSASSTV